MNILSNLIPVFPLNGVILLPKSNLPLNIFEDRYLSMVDYALAKDKKIGMIQPCNKNDKLYKIGCLGKITSFTETEDNRYIINLLGLVQFTSIKEIKTDYKFRLLEVRYQNNNSNLDSIDKNKINKILIEKFIIISKNNNQNMNWDIIRKIDIHDLINLIAMTGPFSSSEKQMLLESKNLKLLSNKLISLLDFYIKENSSTSIN